MPDRAQHAVIREGIIAGALGATAVALWFLIVDVIAGRPFFTPLTLGRALFSVLGAIPADESPLVHLAAYTAFHYIAFAGVGIVAALIIHAAEEEPAVLAGALILFLAFEVGFLGFVALLKETTGLGDLAWYQITIGNLLAASAMGTYLWRTHPELRDELRHALDGTA